MTHKPTIPIAHETLLFEVLCGPSEQLALDDGDRRQPLRWNREAEAARERRRVCCPKVSTSDDAEAQTGRGRLWRVAELTPYLDWLCVTDDAARLGAQVPEGWRNGYPPNVWVGVRASNQAETDARVPALLDLPASVRFLWCEPLRGAIDLTAHLPGLDVRPCPCPCHQNPGISHVKPCCRDGYLHTPRASRLHWVIAGGDTRREAPPLNPYEVYALRDQCRDAQVKFYFTQWGSWAPSFKFTLARKVRFKDSRSQQHIDMVRLRDGRIERTLIYGSSDEVPSLPHPAPIEW